MVSCEGDVGRSVVWVGRDGKGGAASEMDGTIYLYLFLSLRRVNEIGGGHFAIGAERCQEW